MTRLSLNGESVGFGPSGRIVLDDERLPIFGGTQIVAGDTTLTPDPRDAMRLVTIKERTSTGWDDDGNQTFEWFARCSDVPAVFWTQREEVSRDGGQTIIKAKTTVVYDGSEGEITERGVLITDDDVRWQLETVKAFSDRVDLTLMRVSDGP
jgi:hypothetical protein